MNRLFCRYETGWRVVNNLVQQKAQIRAQMLAKRQALSVAEQEQAAQRLVAQIQHLLAASLPQRVAGYWPMRGELDVRPVLAWLQSKGCQTALPRMADDGARHLTFHHWAGEDGELTAGAYGVMQPPADSLELIPELVLCPLVACDAQGNRLGYGGGYYDTTLEGLRRRQPSIRILGVGYAFQQLASLPIEPHDQPMELLLA